MSVTGEVRVPLIFKDTLKEMETESTLATPCEGMQRDQPEYLSGSF